MTPNKFHDMGLGTGQFYSQNQLWFELDKAHLGDHGTMAEGVFPESLDAPELIPTGSCRVVGADTDKPFHTVGFSTRGYIRWYAQ